MSFDIATVRFLNGFVGASPFFDGAIVFCARYVPYLIAILFFVFLYASPVVAGQRLTVFFSVALSTLVARFGVTELIRLFYQRPRPNLSHTVRPLVSEFEWSFPSGHAVFFFALGVAVSLYDPWWGGGFIGAATLVGVSRIAAGVHYPSDIVGGAVIGALVAYVIVMTVAGI